ncbi:hypothetical protein VUR80DRAFT_5836 [Thermomyces stellatus]
MTPGDPQTRALSGSRKPQVAELSRPWPEPSVPAYYVTSEAKRLAHPWSSHPAQRPG